MNLMIRIWSGWSTALCANKLMRTSRDTRRMIDLYSMRFENGTNGRQMDVVTMLVRILFIICV